MWTKINWIECGATAVITVALYHAINYTGWLMFAGGI